VLKDLVCWYSSSCACSSCESLWASACCGGWSGGRHRPGTAQSCSQQGIGA
jgi:hypothetical protein